MPHLLKNGHPAHVFTFEDCSKGGKAKAAKYAGELKERRRRRRRARYLAEREGRGRDWRSEYTSEPYRLPPNPDTKYCPHCGGARRGPLSPQDTMCPGVMCPGWHRNRG
jgi:hypothetical protein